MGQEFFGGPEYYQDFDPEKFARELAKKAELKKQQDSASEDADEEK